jgi:hypothetical protein
MVLADDVPDTLNGTRPPEPLFVRALSNECVVSRATNLIPEALEEDDFQIFTPTDSIGQHIHLFKFDVTSSDGGANGWNYEDGVFAAEEVVARIKAANALGGALVADGTLNQSGARVPLAATSNPFVPPRAARRADGHTALLGRSPPRYPGHGSNPALGVHARPPVRILAPAARPLCRHRRRAVVLGVERS